MLLISFNCSSKFVFPEFYSAFWSISIFAAFTISGVPGRFFLCSLNLYPILCSIDRTIISGFVSLPRIRDMFQLRLSSLIISINLFGLHVSVYLIRFQQSVLPAVEALHCLPVCIVLYDSLQTNNYLEMSAALQLL